MKESCIGTDTEHSLPTEDARIFSMFLAWVYNGVLVPPSKHSPDSEKDGADETPSVRLISGKDRPVLHSSWYDEDLVDLHLFSRWYHIFELANETLCQLAIQNHQNGRTTTALAVRKAFDAPSWQRIGNAYSSVIISSKRLSIEYQPRRILNICRSSLTIMSLAFSSC